MAGALGVGTLPAPLLPRASISCRHFSKMVVGAASLAYGRRRAAC